MNEQHIVVLGNAVDGLTFVGPFDDYDAAMEYAGSYVDRDWHIAPLSAPEEE